MVLIGAVAILALLAAIVAPQVWVRHTLQRHSGDRPDLPGTGGELAEHLVRHFGLEGVSVESTHLGDHYDPETRTVRLSAGNHAGRSITSVAVAAHEVGHAIQHHHNEPGLARRQALVKFARTTDLFATVFFLGAPVLFAIARSPLALLGMVAIGVSLLAIRTLVHLVTLPVEVDASFNKALPILKEGGYLQDEDLKGARSVLKAAAFTYVAAALMSLLDLARWIRVWR